MNLRGVGSTYVAPALCLMPGTVAYRILYSLPHAGLSRRTNIAFTLVIRGRCLLRDQKCNGLISSAMLDVVIAPNMSGFRRAIVFAVWLLIAAPCCAQHMNEPDSSCAGAVTTSDLVDCLGKARTASDGQLNSLYQQIQQKLDSDELKELTTAQRLWIKYRDANCTAARSLYGLGTASTPVYLACLDAMTRERIKELRDTYAVRLK